MNQPDPGPLRRLFAPLKRGWERVRENPAADFALGLTPFGAVADVQDFVSASRSGDVLGMGLAAAGGIPIAGDALKGRKAIRAALEAAGETPPNFAYQRTQRPNTTPTYEAAAREIDRLGASGRGIDYGAGLGIGAQKIGFEDTFEPFPKTPFVPTYTNPADIPSEAYGRLTNLNSLNVLPPNIRNEAVENIGRILEPGGYGVITTRGREVMSARGTPGPEPTSLITNIGTYQKGFSNNELLEYLRYILGNRFDVSSARIGNAPAASTIRKKNQP